MTMFVVGLISLGTAMLFASTLQKTVSRPIIQLAQTADQIAREGNYSVRVQRDACDEIGRLFTAFNHMLAQIAAGEAALTEARDELEDRVRERTCELTQTNEDLKSEVSERKRAEEELRAVQDRLLATAREVGKAEIATSVLHNVGNVLNSVNISSELIRDKLRNSGTADTLQVACALQQHLDDLETYLTQDERGKHLAPFLIDLSRQISDDEQAALNEVQSLTDNIHTSSRLWRCSSHTRVPGG